MRIKMVNMSLEDCLVKGGACILGSVYERLERSVLLFFITEIFLTSR